MTCSSPGGISCAEYSSSFVEPMSLGTANRQGNREHPVTEIQHRRGISNSEHLPIRQVLYAKLLYLLAMGR
jgi:hypothetical protein